MSGEMNMPQQASQNLKLGWLPDFPDFRDCTPQAGKIQPLLAKVGAAETKKVSLPASVDLRQWFSPVEDQGDIGSCTANAGVALVEYFENRAFGKHTDASRLFLYKATRNLLHWTGDTGAFLRSTMKALVLFGVPPEEYWPYLTSDFDKEPPAFCYAFAQNYRAISYYRLDPPGTTVVQLLDRIKTNLASGLPAMFGFTVYTSLSQASKTGRIPFPTSVEKVSGGHAVVVVGYNDDLTIQNSSSGTQPSQGALLIRNSWGSGWGEQGYGWLPYEYVRKGLAVDWWSLIKADWVDTEQFEHP